MVRRVADKQERVPYLTRRVIEEHAQLLLDEWALDHPAITPPIPVDELLELHLKLTLEIGNLRARFGVPDVLGAIWFGERTVRVDSTLDPDVYPAVRGRYHFTLAHEIAHWRLHREHLLSDPSEARLFGESGEPAFVCRSGVKPREEWQADQFAGCLLMPRRLLWAAWTEWRGSDDPMLTTNLSVGRATSGAGDNRHKAAERFCKPLAARFGVSAQAMRIRLESLELLVKEVEPGLF